MATAASGVGEAHIIIPSDIAWLTERYGECTRMISRALLCT